MIEQIIGYQARINPRALAILTTHVSITFAELDAEIDRTVAALEGEAAFVPARRIGIAIDDPVRHWLMILAVLRLGKLSVSLPKLGEAKARTAIAVARLDLVLRDEPSPDADPPAIVIDEAWMLGRPTVFARSAALTELDPSTVVRVVLSSGTTGAPKAVPFSLGGISLVTHLSTTGLGGWRGLTTMGLQAVGGFTMPFLCWARGGAIIFPEENFHWLTVLTTLRPDYLMLTPSDLAALLSSLPADFTPHQLITICLGGSAIPQGVCTEARLRLGARVVVMYGSTEGGSVARMTPGIALSRPGATGYVDPRGVEVEIVDGEGEVLPAGRQGEIRIRGPGLKLYEGADEHGAFRDGWFHPGDIGRLMSDGLLAVEGRTAEFINVGGAKYAPLVIEEVLRACPGVRDVAAFAMTTPQGVASAHLALVTGDDFDLEVANAALRSHFPKLTLHVMTLPAIPRNAMGKAEHQTLRRMAAAQKAS